MRPNRLRDLVNAAIAKVGSGRALAARLGGSQGQVSDWRNGHVAPSLERSISIAQAAEVDLVPYLLEERSYISDIAGVRAVSSGRRSAVPWTQVEEVLQASLDEDPPPTLRLVVARTGHDLRGVRQRLPVECAEVRKRWEDWRSIQASNRSRAIQEAVTRVVIELRDEGKRPSRRMVEKRLGGLSVREQQVRSAWRAAVAGI